MELGLGFVSAHCMCMLRAKTGKHLRSAQRRRVGLGLGLGLGLALEIRVGVRVRQAPPQRTKATGWRLRGAGVGELSRVGSRLPRLSAPRRCRTASSPESSPVASPVASPPASSPVASPVAPLVAPPVASPVVPRRRAPTPRDTGTPHTAPLAPPPPLPPASAPPPAMSSPTLPPGADPGSSSASPPPLSAAAGQLSTSRFDSYTARILSRSSAASPSC